MTEIPLERKDKNMKNMFYFEGLPNSYDGRCADCPFSMDSECPELGADVSNFINNGRINKCCPFIQKEELKNEETRS